jgi:hypothetical protein
LPQLAEDVWNHHAPEQDVWQLNEGSQHEKQREEHKAEHFFPREKCEEKKQGPCRKAQCQDVGQRIHTIIIKKRRKANQRIRDLRNLNGHKQPYQLVKSNKKNPENNECDRPRMCYAVPAQVVVLRDDPLVEGKFIQQQSCPGRNVEALRMKDVVIRKTEIINNRLRLRLPPDVIAHKIHLKHPEMKNKADEKGNQKKENGLFHSHV